MLSISIKSVIYAQKRNLNSLRKFTPDLIDFYSIDGCNLNNNRHDRKISISMRRKKSETHFILTHSWCRVIKFHQFYLPPSWSLFRKQKPNIKITINLNEGRFKATYSVATAIHLFGAIHCHWFWSNIWTNPIKSMYQKWFICAYCWIYPHLKKDDDDDEEEMNVCTLSKREKNGWNHSGLHEV